MPARGAFSQAAEKLMASLSSKLEADGSAELKSSVRRAIGLVEAFLANPKEDEAAWEALKAQVKQAIFTKETQPQSSGRQSIPGPSTSGAANARVRQSADTIAHPSPRAQGAGLTKGSTRGSTYAVEGHEKGSAFPWLAKGSTGRPLKATNVPQLYKSMFDAGPEGPITSIESPQHKLQGSLARSSTADLDSSTKLWTCTSNVLSSQRTGSGSRVWGGARHATNPEPPIRPALYNSMLRSEKAVELDFSLPRHTLRPLAYTSTLTTYDQMVVNQDKLAKEAEAYALQLNREKTKHTRACYAEQYALVEKRMQEEVEAKRMEAKEMEAKLRRIREEDEAQQRAEEAAHAALAAEVQAQAAELRKLQAHQRDQHQRAIKLDRVESDRLEAQERDRLAKLFAAQKAHMKQVQEDLAEALAIKAEQRKHRLIDEQMYNEKCMGAIAAAEAKREAEVKAHSDKLNALFARGGGEELQVAWEAKLQRERDTLERQLRKFQEQEQIRLKKEADLRKQQKDEWLRILDTQTIEREAAKMADDGVKAAERAALTAKLELQRQLDKDAAAKRSEDARELFAQKKDAAFDATQRVVQSRLLFPGDDKNLWVHNTVANGTSRGFTNLSVPEKGNKIDMPTASVLC